MSSLSYTVRGNQDRPAILFLHGFMGSAGDWEPAIAVLEERFYCVAVDLPGHGDSLDLPSEGYTMEGTTGLLVALLDELDVGLAVVVGYSMGGRLALYFALRLPERCSGLLLESASPGLKSAEERAERRRADDEKAARLESEDFGEFLEDWYRQPIFASLARDEAILLRTIESRSRNEPDELARSLRGMGTGSQPSLWGELAGLTAPTMAVAGELDEKFVSIGRRVEAGSPMVSFVSLPDVGHNIRAEAPVAYIGLLRDFLESL